MYGDITRLAVTATSIVLTIGLYAQVVKIFKTKSASDFSWVVVVALLFDSLAWLNYGFYLWEWPIITIGLTSFPAVVGALVGYIMYGQGRKANV